jgi:hypothetical protein
MYSNGRKELELRRMGRCIPESQLHCGQLYRKNFETNCGSKALH